MMTRKMIILIGLLTMTTCPQESLTVIVIVIDEKVMMVRVEVFES